MTTVSDFYQLEVENKRLKRDYKRSKEISHFWERECKIKHLEMENINKKNKQLKQRIDELLND